MPSPALDICNSEAYTLTGGSVGFRYNSEASVRVNNSLFDKRAEDTPEVTLDSVVLYRYADNSVAYKGIVRRIERSLSGESSTLSVTAAESVLEGLEWKPKYAGYRAEMLCKDSLPKATLADFIKYEYTENDSGPQDWFTEVELPDSLKELPVGPFETYQQSFLSLLEAAISQHKHIEWLIEYEGTDVLPIGKLILVDTTKGRGGDDPAIELEVGDGLSDLSVTEDGTETAKTLEVFGGGYYYEKDETLTPAWDVADEKIDTEIVVPGPSSAGEPGEILTTYVDLEYYFTSDVICTVRLGGPFTGTDVLAFAGKDFLFNPTNSSLRWNPAQNYINPETGDMAEQQVTTQWRKLIGSDPRFIGSTITLKFSYAGPDAYQLYRTSEPIAALRYRRAKTTDPRTPEDTVTKISQLVSQETVIIAMGPFISLDLENRYEDQVDPNQFDSHKPLARILKVAEDRITWDERNPSYAPGPGFCIPLVTPQYQEGRDCVRFPKKQLTYVAPLFTDLTATASEDRPALTRWLTWPIKVRYTAWRNLQVTETGEVGDPYVARFVFKDLIKYVRATELDKDGVVIEDILQDDTEKLEGTAARVKEYYGKAKWVGSAKLIVDLEDNADLRSYTPPVKLGDQVKLKGECSTYLKDHFKGIINSIDLASGETGSLSVTIGPNARLLSPFEEQPPVAVDAGSTALRVQDISTLDRRSL